MEELLENMINNLELHMILNVLDPSLTSTVLDGESVTMMDTVRLKDLVKDYKVELQKILVKNGLYPFPEFLIRALLITQHKLIKQFDGLDIQANII
jgi:hypothetical protein